MVRFEVLDNGPGIAPEYRARVFERFYRVDAGRSDAGRSKQEGGTGLGLSIVRNLVHSMGGDVGVERGESVGSVFWFVLPAGKPQ